MPAKDIIYDAVARDKILSGVNALANAVKPRVAKMRLAVKANLRMLVILFCCRSLWRASTAWG